jgi:septation ring formation regulator EzrA
MSIDDALSAFLNGEAKIAADQLDALSAMADQLRDSQQHLRDSEDKLRDSRADLRQSQDELRQSQDDAQAKGEEIQQLHRALASRDIIGQVKGMLMERFNIDAVAAFELLVKLSQKSNTRVEIIAHKLVELDHPGAEPNG